MKVPEATISALRRSRSSRDPSHQYTSSGWVSSAIFSTQATRSAGASAGALSVIRWVVIWSSDFLGCEGQQQRRPADGVLLTQPIRWGYACWQGQTLAPGSVCTPPSGVG